MTSTQMPLAIHQPLTILAAGAIPPPSNWLWRPQEGTLLARTSPKAIIAWRGGDGGTWRQVTIAHFDIGGGI